MSGIRRTLRYGYGMTLLFDGEVSRHSFTFRCEPRDTLRQKVIGSGLTMLPDVRCSRNADAFGNRTVEGTLMSPHSSFSISVQGEVLVPAGEPEWPLPEDAESRGDRLIYRQQTRRTMPGPSINSFLSSAPDCACDGLSRAVGLMHRLHSSFSYVKGATGPETTAEEAMARGEGVCQDYAQILLSLLRARGIPCRYVVGYTVGEGESHAWVEVLDGGTWYGLDPTGDRAVGQDHVKVSHGRDYDDCRINRGVFYGGRVASQQVLATVSPEEVEP